MYYNNFLGVYMEYIFYGCLIVIIAVIVIALGILLVVRSYEKKYVLDITKISGKCDSVIVLGAGVRADGNPCDLLADRIKTGVEVYLKDKCKTILLTGEDKDETYNEVLVMKRWINKNYEDIDDDVILLDGLGLCTYDSIYRAKYIFNINRAIISTNRYHLARAIYVARRLGIEAYGIPSDLRAYDRMKKYKKREALAQIKDFLLVNLFRIKKIFRR